MDGYIERQTLQDIADAIREKNGSSDTYKPSEMAEAILDLSGSVNLQDKSVTITENGTQTIVADEGFDGLSSVEVTADVEKNAGFDLVSRGMTQEFQDEVNANLLKDAIDYTITTMNRTSDSGSWSGKFVNSRILFCTKSLKNITNLKSVFESTHIYSMVDLDIAKAGNIYHFFYQSTCPYIPSYIDLSGLANTNNASAFRATKILKNEDTLTINVGWYADKGNMTYIDYFFYDVTQEKVFNKVTIIGDTLTSLTDAFMSCKTLEFEMLHTESLTGISILRNSKTVKKITYGSVKNITNLSYIVFSMSALEELYFTEWKQGNATMIYSSLLKSQSIRYIIWHALNGENTLGFENEGATSRTLKLNATPYASWETWKLTKPSVEDCEYLDIDETEITKYGELTWEDIALSIKLITIGA